MKVKSLTMLILLIALCVVSVVFASYDTPPQPKASPDLAEFIIKTPAALYEKHGYSERTDIMYNLARFKELYIESAQQIKMLNDRVKLLEDKTKELEDKIKELEDAQPEVVEKIPNSITTVNE